MKTLNKAAIVAMSLIAMGAEASTALDTVRDNLKGAYNDIKAQSWGATNTGRGAAALGTIAQYVSTITPASSGILTVSYDASTGFTATGIDPGASSFDSDVLSGHVTTLSNGVITDFFGTTDLTSVVTVGTHTDGGAQINVLGQDNPINQAATTVAGNYLVTGANTANLQLRAGNYAAAATSLNGTFSTVNAALVGTNGLSSAVSTLSAITSSTVSDFALTTNASGQIVSGTECFADYAGYASDTVVACSE